MSDPNSEDDFLDLCDDSSPSPPVFKTQAKNTKSSDVKPLPVVNETETNTNQHSASGNSIQNLETNTKLPSASRSSSTFCETKTKHPLGSTSFNKQSDNASDLEDYSDIESDESVVCMAGYKLGSDAQNSDKTSKDQVDTKAKTQSNIVTISDESDSDANGSGKVIDVSSDHESGCENQKRNSNANLCTSTLKRSPTTGITKSDTNLDITPPKRIRSEATGHPVNVQVNDLWDTQTYFSYAEAKEQYLKRKREDYAQRKLEEKENSAAKTKSKVNDHSIRSKDSEKSFSEQVNGAWETVQPKFSYARTKEEYLQRQGQDYDQSKLEEKNQTKFSNVSTTEKSAYRQREGDAQIKMKEQTNTYTASAVNDNITTHKKSESEDNAVDVKVKDSDDQSETDKTRNRKQRLQKEVEEYAMIKLREMFPNTDEKEIRDRVTSENSDGTLTDTSIVERVVEIILGSTDEISGNVGQDVQIAIANPRLQVSQDNESKAMNPKAKNQMTNDRKGKGLMKKVPKDDIDYDMETDSVYSQECPEVNPSPVTKPDLVVRTGDNSVRLRWKHIDTNLFPSYDVHTRYMVEVQAPPCDTWKVVAKNIAGLVYEVQLDLKPFQDYQFRVRAVTRYGDMSEPSPVAVLCRSLGLIPAQTSNDHNSPSINKNLVLNKNGNHFKKGYEYLVSGPDGKPKKYYFDGEKFVVPKTFVTVTHTYSCEEDLTDPKATKVETTKSVFSLNKKFIEGANGKSDFIKGHSYMVSGPNGLKKKLIFDGKKFVDPDPNESQHNITSSSQNTSCTTNTNHPKVEDMECFHGNISRHLAEQLLCHRENGIYLVRETNKGRKALSVVCDGHVSHYMIQLDESDNKVYFEHNVKFDTVSELLQHYSDNFGLSTKLKNFVPRIPKDQGMDRLEHVTPAATNEEVTSTTLACEACLSTITTDKIVQCCDGHLNCSSCVEKVVKKVLSNESEEAQISCSYSINKKQDCTSYIPESQAKKVLPKLVFELLEEKLAKKASEAIDKMTDIYSCPSCQMKVVIEGDMKKFTCPQCKTVTCRYCNKPWSTGCHDKCTMHILMVNSEEMETSNSDWCTVPEGHRDFAAVELDHTNSREFQFVCSLFRGKKDRVGCLNRVNKVFRINNPRLWQKFRLAKEHMMEDIGIENINEQHLFHGTGTSAVGGICRDGFDWRLCGANATVYGDGSYFAKNSSYSIKYCRDSKSSTSASSRNARIATMMSQIINSTALVQGHGGSFGGPTTSSSNSVNNPSLGPTTFHYGGSSINSASAKVAQKLGRKPSTNTLSFSSVTHYPPQSNSGPSFGAQLNSGPSFGAQPNSGPSFGAQPNSGPNFGAPNSAQPNTGLGFGINIGPQSSNSGSNLSSVPPNLSQHFQNFLNQHQGQPAQPSGISSSGPRVFTFGALPTNPNDNSPSQPSEVPLEEKFIDKNKRYMFLGRVLVGRPCRGVHGMKKPPRDENNRPYNSASDNPDKPSIYIIFDSAQCYPEYLIEFQ